MQKIFEIFSLTYATITTTYMEIFYYSAYNSAKISKLFIYFSGDMVFFAKNLYLWRDFYRQSIKTNKNNTLWN